MHEGRTEWTPAERTVDLVNAIAAGTLDACSGWHVRAGVDTPESLRDLAAGAENGSVAATARRRLRVLPAGPDDPLGERFTGE
jgi:2-keto-3-deoxy-galactonokinase